MALATALDVAAERIEGLGLREEACRCVVALASSDRVPVCEAGLKSLESFVNRVKGGDVSPMYTPLCQVREGGRTLLKLIQCGILVCTPMCMDLHSIHRHSHTFFFIFSLSFSLSPSLPPSPPPELDSQFD